MTVGDLADKAMIAQKAKVPTNASGELPVGTAGAPSKRSASRGEERPVIGRESRGLPHPAVLQMRLPWPFMLDLHAARR